jgi:hypothetical protein
MQDQIQECVNILTGYFNSEKERIKQKEYQIQSCLDTLSVIEKDLKQKNQELENLKKPVSWHMNLLEVVRQFV